ncbi:MAG: carbon-nitrogen hydrolase family protein [Anaerolineae bacterium]|nr:carbon-nitrogen hydrolase family protein [Anaerolineae bacterium]
MNAKTHSYLWLLIGSALLLFMGWHWNVPVALWLAPVFLMRFFRTQERWPATLLAVPPMALALFANIHGGWDFSIPAELGLGLARALPFLLALTADRALHRRLPPILALLVYPAVYVAGDFLIGLTPLGTVFSVAATQFELSQFLQLAAAGGIWGMGFVMSCLAPVANRLWEHDFDAGRAGALPAIYGALLAAILLLGGWRLRGDAPAPTVRVAGITVPHARDYWGAIIDLNTPEEIVQSYAEEFASLEDRLFAESARAAGFGAPVIFWAEGEAMLTPETEPAFMARAQAFAREHGVYLMPTYVVLHYGTLNNDNRLAMITPEGEIAFTYTKTQSWYPTDSDGVLHWVDTPYGRIGGAICFDMDFPALIHQAGKAGVDIMLVPAYDWEPIKPYHTEVGLFRAVENGMAIFRQVNEGTSMAVDYRGRLLAYQDYFDTGDPLLLADLPTKGVRTLYSLLGDWVAYGCVVLAVVLAVIAIVKREA